VAPGPIVNSHDWQARLAAGPSRVASVGDNCVDVYVDTQRTNIGGNAVNVAIDLAGHGVRADFFGRLGDDDDGLRIERTLGELGVASRAIITAEATCRGLLRIGPNGTTALVGIDGDCSYYRPSKTDFDTFCGYSIVYMKAVDEADRVIGELRDRDICTAYDYSVFHEELGTTAADISLFSAEDRDRVGIQKLLEQAAERGSHLAVVTRGAEGSIALFQGEFIETPAQRVSVVDTIGAGDAFAAALLAGLLEGKSVRDSLRKASVAGSQTCTFEGAWQAPLARRENN
jgi:fructoselysine 6-kinase